MLYEKFGVKFWGGTLKTPFIAILVKICTSITNVFVTKSRLVQTLNVALMLLHWRLCLPEKLSKEKIKIMSLHLEMRTESK